MSMYHDVMEALTPIVDAFEQLGIAYYLGGSVSSSLHGLARRTQDVDVIADVEPSQVRRRGSTRPALQRDPPQHHAEGGSDPAQTARLHERRSASRPAVRGHTQQLLHPSRFQR